MTPAPRVYYRPFGSLRLGLALVVVLYHAPAIVLPRWAAMCGPVAVFVFFALSGFIIAEAAEMHYSNRPSAFIANRFVRLYPLYLVALLLVVVVSFLPGFHFAIPAYALDWRNLAVNTLAPLPIATPAQRLLGLTERYEFISVIWAIRVEFAFYFVVFASLLAGRLIRARLHQAALVGALSAALGVHVVSFYVRPLFAADAIISYAPFIVAGTAYYCAGSARSTRARGSFLAIAMIAGILSIPRTAVYPLLNMRDGGLGAAAGRPPREAAFGAVCMFIALASLAGWLAHRKVAPRLSVFDRKAGDLSYPVYLVHTASILLLSRFFIGRAWISTMLLLAATLPTAHLLNVAARRFFDPLRDRMRGGPIAEVGTVAPGAGGGLSSSQADGAVA